MKDLSRRTLLAGAPVAAGSVLLASERHVAASVLRRLEGGPALSPNYPTQEASEVNAFVGAAHTQLDRVTEMLAARPDLAKANWDWGFGDWESALGAASHVGRRDIAEVLMAHGARPNLFTLAMLGKVDAVRAICTAAPGIQRTLGPHDITLMRHALAGKNEAEDVVAYLTQLGGADEQPASEPLDESAASLYFGRYAPAGTVDTTFVVGWHERQQKVTFQRDEATSRALFYLGDHTFRPAGSKAVRLTFEVIEGLSLSLTIQDGEFTLPARRTGS